MVVECGKWSMRFLISAGVRNTLEIFFVISKLVGINCTQPPARDDVTSDWDEETLLFEHTIM